MFRAKRNSIHKISYYKKAVSEAEIHEQIAKYLDYAFPNPDIARWSHLSAEALGILKEIGDLSKSQVIKNKAFGSIKRLKKQGSSAGWPDITVIASGKILFIEIKSKSGSLGVEQQGWRDLFLRNNIPYCLARSAEDVEDFLRKHDVALCATLQIR